LVVQENWSAAQPRPVIHSVFVAREAKDESNRHNLAADQKHEDGCSSVQKQLALAAGERVQISTSVTRTVPASGRHPVHFSHATKDCVISLYHPDEILVGLDIFHPAHERLVLTSDDDTYKRWEFEPGFLPYQGFELVWRTPDEPARAQQVAAPEGTIEIPTNVTYVKPVAAAEAPSADPGHEDPDAGSDGDRSSAER
jgi:hypothetical protein